MLVLLGGIGVSSYFAVEANRKATDEAKARAFAQDETKRAEQNAEAEKKARNFAEDETKRANDRNRRSEWSLYVSKLLLAQAAYNENNILEAFCYLDEFQWDLRGWEDAHLRRRFDSSKQTLTGHKKELLCVAWSPDGKRILTGSADSTAKVWDAENGTELLSMKGHTSQVIGVAWSPDGDVLFAWYSESQVVAWDAATGQSVPVVNPPPSLLTPGSAVSPDGRLHAKSEGYGIAIRNLQEPPLIGSPWPFPDAAERKRYHSAQAEAAKQEKNWFAAAFHLGRLLLDDPDNAELKKRHEEAMQKHTAPAKK